MGDLYSFINIVVDFSKHVGLYGITLWNVLQWSIWIWVALTLVFFFLNRASGGGDD